MKKFINFIMLISIVTTNNNTFYADTIQSTCDLVTASESTTANCNQKMLALQNGSFEDLGNLSFADYKIANEADVLGWESTAPAGTIELWKKSFYESQHPGIDSSMIDGNVLAELNSSSVGALYQDFETEPGQIINIYVKHGGRIQKDLHGEQNMGVYVGVPRVDYSDTNYSAELYPTEGLSNDLMYNSAVLPGEWNEIAFQYVVPDGQTTTRIAFNSLDAGSMGNFIDEIKVGVDSVYDNEVIIESVTGGNSFADTYRVTNVLNHIGGDVIGKFEVFIDTSGLKNLRQFEIRDMDNNDVTDLTTIEYVKEDHIKISGDTFIEGTVTFVAESTLEETGQIVVDSDLKYVSELYLDFVRLGEFTSDGVLETRDIASLQLEDYAPVISYENVTVNEAELSSGVNIEELLKVSVEDKEDDITGFNTELIVDAGTIDYHKPGIYNVNITAVDGQGQTASETATITINDLQPKITSSINTVELPLGNSQDSVNYTQLFDVKATEITDGDLTSKLIVTSNVNFATTGLYTVNFFITDDEGNTDTLDRTVKIVRNNHSDIETIDNGVNARPEIELTKLSLDVNEHNSLSDSELISKYGVSVTDDLDTNLQITVDQSKVDYTKPGIYEVEFSTTDSKGLKAVQTAQLQVIDVLPAINGNKNNVELQLSEANDQIDFVGLFEVKASEITDGDLTSKISVDYSAVNFNATGSYTVSFLVTDDEGNTDTLDRTLTIVRNNHSNIETIDNGVNTRPEIGLTKLSLDVNEHNPLSASELISKYGVSVTDDSDTNLQINVDQSKVDYTKPGIYEIEFSTTDSKGLKAVQTAQLQVNDVLPVINGNKNNVELQLSEANDQIDFVELFEVKASEITDGDLTSKISVDFSAVNFNSTGSYTVSFLVTDDEGNTDTLDRTLELIRNSDGDFETIDNGVNTRPEIELAKLSLDVNEHNPLSASELISKYGVSVTDDSDTNLQISVDQTKVDYTKPGIYEIEFSTTDSKGLKAVQTAQLQVNDVLPVINTNKNTVELQLNEVKDPDQIDFVGLFDVVAKEISAGDLTSEIIVDFSEVNFNATGTYNVYFKVIDEEGNETLKTTKLVITRSTLGDAELIDNTVDPLPVVDSETGEKEDTVVSEVETSDPETTVDKEDTVANEVSKSNVVVNSSNKSKSTKVKKGEVNNKNSEYKEMTLSNTGQESMFILLIAALLGLISIKKLSNKKASANL